MTNGFRNMGWSFLLCFGFIATVFGQTRAPAGGAFVNGRYYKGGQFLPSDLPSPDLNGRNKAGDKNEVKPADAVARRIDGKVVGVTDGDTISVYPGIGKPVKVRLEGIDSPESKQDFGDAAKRHLSDLVFGKQVSVQVTGKDKYGRTLGTVFLDRQNVNRTMITDGFAWHYKKYNSDPDLADAEKSARASRRGLWSMRDPTPPWEFRHK